ncbi:hypothetical protein SIO70_00295 [Chitinophaga sancti]|uniref:nSTAND1 domain-containing NTPase n=1 Tax=Chitinophaga sancti TaxID=1004 RepID=UPI002A75BCCD|nr:hypothetical protein [Chitinophaga sancti]WPQ63302.1 hypothetical protein SIO70_00295 [Chitinophaga sancti]
MNPFISGNNESNGDIEQQPINPFRFLRSFKREEINEFSGRNEDVLNLYSLVRGRSIQLIFGESGVGKTSLVLCGLANHFKKSDWYDVLILRKKNIMASIRQELTYRLLKNDVVDPEDMMNTEMLGELKEGALIELLYKKYYKPVYLIFDQIEELFLFGENDEKVAFFTLMKEVLSLRSKYCKVILIIRQEFHAKLKEFENKVVPVFSAGYEVKRVDQGKAHKIIAEGLEKQREHVRCYPDLDTIAAEIGKVVKGDGGINLLQLQVFMFYLWNRAMKGQPKGEKVAVFTEHLVREVGALEDPLREYVRETVEEIAEGKEGFVWEYLCQFVSEETTKMPVNVSNMKGSGNWLDVLVKKQIVRKMDEVGNYELSHDKLAPIIWAFRPKQERPRLMTPTIIGNPYKGLDSYDDIDQDIIRFFGRTAMVNDLISRIMDKKSVAIVGASGTGKSSIIKAGILPKLKEAGYRVITGKPDENPAIFKRRALKFLQNNPDCRKVVIYVDQFEELSTKCKSPNLREDFIKFLEEKINDDIIDIRVILSIRSDYEYEFDRRMKNWRTSKVVLPKIGREEIREIITEPVYQAGLEYKPTSLVNIILDEGERLGNFLPLLSYALSEMYEEYVNSKRGDGFLTEDDYNKIGGVADGLRSRAEEIFKEAGKETRRTIKNVMLRMVSRGLGEKAGRKVADKELIFEQDEENNRVKDVLDKFLKKRLLKMSVNDHGFIWYEPAHDSLIKAWDKIDEWIEEHGEDLYFLHDSLLNAILRYKEDETTWDGSRHLEKAKTILESADNWFNKEESEFIRASLVHRKERKDRKKKYEEERERLVMERQQHLEKLNDAYKNRDEKNRRSKKILIAGLGVITISTITLALLSYRLYQTNKLISGFEIAKINMDKAIADSTKLLAIERMKVAEDVSTELRSANLTKDSALRSVVELNKSLSVKNKQLFQSLLDIRRSDSIAQVEKKGRATASLSGRRLELARSYESSNPALAYRILQRAERLDPTNEDIRGYYNSFGNKLGYYEKIDIDSAQNATFSADGSYFKTVRDKQFVNIYDTAGFKIGDFYERGEILNTAFSPAGLQILSVTRSRLKIYDINGNDLNWKQPIPTPILQAFYDEEGTSIIAITPKSIFVLPAPGSTKSIFQYNINSDNIIDVYAGSGVIQVKTVDGVEVYYYGRSDRMFFFDRKDGEPNILPNGGGVIIYKGGFLKYFAFPFTRGLKFIRLENMGLYNGIDMSYTTISGITSPPNGDKLFFTIKADPTQLQQSGKGNVPLPASDLRPRIFEMNKFDATAKEIGFRKVTNDLSKALSSPDGKLLLTGESGFLGVYNVDPFKQAYTFGANNFTNGFDVYNYSSWVFHPENANIILTCQENLLGTSGRTKMWILGWPKELDSQKRLANYSEEYLESLELR